MLAMMMSVRRGISYMLAPRLLAERREAIALSGAGTLSAHGITVSVKRRLHVGATRVRGRESAPARIHEWRSSARSFYKDPIAVNQVRARRWGWISAFLIFGGRTGAEGTNAEVGPWIIAYRNGASLLRGTAILGCGGRDSLTVSKRGA